MPDTTTFAYALHLMPGVGRVTANRLLERFATYEDLLGYPREQVLVRIKGAPNAEALVNRLFDRDGMQTLFTQAEEDIAELARRKVEVTSPHDPFWPDRLGALDLQDRPELLFSYGDRALLNENTLLGLFARPPVSSNEYELVQTLVEKLLPAGVIPMTATSSGFDVVFHKLAAGRRQQSMLVASCGLAKIPTQLRPTASAAVRGGGLLVTSFPLTHGPYEHDGNERAALQAALARACVFVNPRAGKPEYRALDWALDHDRPCFVIDTEDAPNVYGTVPILGLEDFGLVRQALGLSE